MLLLLLVAVSFVVTGCETVQPARRPSLGVRTFQPTTAGASPGAVAARPPGPRQPVMQITAPPSPWKTEAERWYGTPYRFGGNDANGFDCSGFAAVLYNRVAGMNLPRTSLQQFQLGRGVSQDDLRPGDLVFFRSPNSSAVTHVGVYVGGSYFTHASTSRGVTFNSIKESYYRHNFHGARRVVGAQAANPVATSVAAVSAPPIPRPAVLPVASVRPTAVTPPPASVPSGPRPAVMQITAPDSPWKAEAERLYGTPYSEGGNGANGFDCPGFAAALYNRVAGVSLPRTSAQQLHVGRDVPQDDMRPGDLVFFRSPDSGSITQMGVYLGGSYFTHASTSRGVTFSSIRESFYRRNFHGARRVVGG